MNPWRSLLKKYLTIVIAACHSAVGWAKTFGKPLLEKHFLIAVVLLGLSAVCWGVTVRALKWALLKEPVPWPESAKVTSDFRLESLHRTLGPYVLCDGSKSSEDAQPEGEVVLTDDELGVLKIGTADDRKRYGNRSSNWYLVRRYRDTRKSARDPYRFWQLDVYYYTGMLDQVPHVPERCLVAGGAAGVESSNVTFHVPNAPTPWDQPFQFERTRYEVRQGLTPIALAQYYGFSLNGKPEKYEKYVRMGLTVPWNRYCYFAKIQFAPISPGGIADFDVADAEARDFLSCVLPDILKNLPMPRDVEKLNSAPR